ncbi:TrmB family transcriptional regulator [Halogeometricum sp. S1BR25-6]|uniref:TrmB family transcriptional regulator n=1 Tax=Halogeometricum salsisoli TaxID=2950536 RepID=A0ABU2G9W3_9EURY|nr:helix-turn-helix domain-containing protein [Halogeometricum sp. S1BR25-6]MDS0297590.1 TrmB family transcriptional regulator [Halogeometricum sp. S1BR25-6]
MPNESAAADALIQLGLTEYEAKCFVALTRISRGTAKEISRLSEVPRSRVYDTVERLHQRGLVDVQQSEPRRYRAVSTDDALERLRRDYDDSIEAAADAFETVESAETQEDKGMWAISDSDHVSDRMETLLDEATEHVHFLLADKTTLQDGVADRLAAACDRGVTVVVEVPSERAAEDIRETVPGARVEISEGLRETHRVVEKWPGQLMMVDHKAVLASGVEKSDLPGITKETAVWSNGHNHGFAAWIRELLYDRIDETALPE